MGEMRNEYATLIGKREGRKPLRRPRCGWEYNIKIDLKGSKCEGF
jgi:hypothetical protein